MNDGILGGTQVVLPVTAPITIGGNAVSVVGESTVTGPGTTLEPTPARMQEPPPGTTPGTITGASSGGAAAAAAPRLAMTDAAEGPAMTGGVPEAGLAALAALLLLLGATLLRGRHTMA